MDHESELVSAAHAAVRELQGLRMEVLALRQDIHAIVGAAPVETSSETPAAAPNDYVHRDDFLALVAVVGNHLLPDLEAMMGREKHG